MTDPCSRQYRAEVWDIMQFLFSRFNDHQIHCVVRLAARLDENRLTRAVGRLIEAFPLIRCRFVEDKKGPYWEGACWAAEDMVFLRETDRAEEEIQAVVCSETDVFAGPSCSIISPAVRMRIRWASSSTICSATAQGLRSSCIC